MEVVKEYSKPDEFWSEVFPHLKKEIAVNSLLLGISYSFLKSSKSCDYQSALFINGKFSGALVCSAYHSHKNILLSPIEKNRHANLLYSQFKKSKINLSGIIGEIKTVNTYKDLICADNIKMKKNMSQGVYRCTKVELPVVSRNVNFRIAALSDAKKIGEWIEGFRNEAVPHDPPINGFEHAKIKINQKAIFVLEKNGELVSMAGWSRDIKISGSVILVYTPVAFRKKGYGGLVTAKLTQYMLDRGKEEVHLYTDMNNPTSNKIYKNIGFEFVCDSAHYGVIA